MVPSTVCLWCSARWERKRLSGELGDLRAKARSTSSARASSALPKPWCLGPLSSGNIRQHSNLTDPLPRPRHRCQANSPRKPSVAPSFLGDGDETLSSESLFLPQQLSIPSEEPAPVLPTHLTPSHSPSSSTLPATAACPGDGSLVQDKRKQPLQAQEPEWALSTGISLSSSGEAEAVSRQLVTAHVSWCQRGLLRDSSPALPPASFLLESASSTCPTPTHTHTHTHSWAVPARSQPQITADRLKAAPDPRRVGSRDTGALFSTKEIASGGEMKQTPRRLGEGPWHLAPWLAAAEEHSSPISGSPTTLGTSGVDPSLGSTQRKRGFYSIEPALLTRPVTAEAHPMHKPREPSKTTGGKRQTISAQPLSHLISGDTEMSSAQDGDLDTAPESA